MSLRFSPTIRSFIGETAPPRRLASASSSSFRRADHLATNASYLAVLLRSIWMRLTCGSSPSACWNFWSVSTGT